MIKKRRMKKRATTFCCYRCVCVLSTMYGFIDACTVHAYTDADTHIHICSYHSGCSDISVCVCAIKYNKNLFILQPRQPNIHNYTHTHMSFQSMGNWMEQMIAGARHSSCKPNQTKPYSSSFTRSLSLILSLNHSFYENKWTDYIYLCVWLCVFLNCAFRNTMVFFAILK